jgi:peptidoglycan hydrolase-like protein with peptidoglycan-binding domain
MTAMNGVIEISRRGAILATVRERVAEEKSTALVRVGAVTYSQMVQIVQSALVASGYDVGPLGADGILGPKTTEAIRKYQIDHGMTPTGTVEDAVKDVVGAAGAIGAAAGGAAAKAATTEIAKTVKTDLVLPVVLMTVVVVLGGIAIWALTRKGI